MCSNRVSNVYYTPGPACSTELLLVSQTTGKVEARYPVTVCVDEDIALVRSPARMYFRISIMTISASPQ